MDETSGFLTVLSEDEYTVYTYDTVGNLTGVNYPSSTDVSFQYDWLNRVRWSGDRT
jgi:hypothetical protein